MRAPVLRFVAVVAIAATALVLVAASGAAAPAIDARPMGSGTSGSGKVGYLRLEIENIGALPVRVTDVTWPTDGLRDAELLVGPVEGAPTNMEPLGTLVLKGGENRAIMIQGTIICPLPGDVVTVATDPVEITAKPAAGPTRTMELDLASPGQGMETTLPCPPR